MTNRDLARGGVKAWGVVWVIDALASVPQIVLMLKLKAYPTNEVGLQEYALWSQLIGLITALTVGGFLIWGADRVAERIFPGERELQIGLDGGSLQAILFSAIGLYLVVNGIHGTLASAFQLLQKPPGDTRRGLEYVWQETKEGLIKSLLGLALGLVVFFGARGLTGIWQRYRNAGAQDISDETAGDGPADGE